MKLFVGLGNPGAEHAMNRHNIGFMALDRIAADHGFAPWRARFQGLLSEGRLGSEKVLLLKPQTYMNLSGQSVGEALRFFKLDAPDVTVFHDELDLAPAKLRLKHGGGHAGHNGLRSIDAHIGPHYTRVRMGIGHPGHKDRVAGYVLQNFAKADADWLEDLLTGLSEGAADLAEGADAKFQNAVALRLSPPRPSTGEKGPAKKPAAAEKPGDAKPGAPKPEAAKATAPKPIPADPRPAAPAEDTRSPLQRLADKFR